MYEPCWLEPLINNHLSYDVSNRGPFLGSSILVSEFPFVINLFYEQLPDTMVWSLCSLYVSDFCYKIVMVSPGTHLVKNRKSQSRTIESQFIKQWFPGSFVTTQLIWRQTPKLRFVWFQNISIPFPGKTLLFAPLTSQDFPFQGVFDDFQNLKFAILPIKTDIPQAVAFLVFLGIALSIRESMSASDKLSNFESAEATV